MRWPLAETQGRFDRSCDLARQPCRSQAGATVVFDLDGTLVDSAPDLVGTLNELLGHQDGLARPLPSSRPDR